MHLIFPDLACESAFELFYSRIGQHTSIGNFWNDPRHQVKLNQNYLKLKESNIIKQTINNNKLNLSFAGIIFQVQQVSAFCEQ